jgi:primosomal protein N' (replication factor Y) (superfamily II helicase)
MSKHTPLFSSFASVLLDVAIDKPLDYGIPLDLEKQIQRGSFVQVPLRGQARKGVVLEVKQESAFKRCLPVSSLLFDTPLLTSDLFELALWMARYYSTPLRKVLKVLLPPSIRNNQQAKKQLFVKLVKSRPETAKICAELQRKFPAQAKILEGLLSTTKGLLLSELLEKTESSKSPVETLSKKGLLELQTITIDRSPFENQEHLKTKPKTLNSEQEESLKKIIEGIETNSFKPFLLFGITGSGKTEVYLQAIAHALSKGKATILLVPEIALTTQTISRFRCRFGENIAILHHRLSQGERRDQWEKIRLGKCSIVIGPRSAIFSPLPNLGLIIVDEEHEQSYKQQDDMPCYHARDISMMRGLLNKCSVILGSATPSIESFNNVKNSKYQLLTLKQRADNASCPTVSIVDMRAEKEKSPHGYLFSSSLLNGIEKRIEQGEQIILFLNRRGYNTSSLCQDCGKTVSCPHCDSSLSFHKHDSILICHLCQFTITPPPKTCPNCKGESQLKYQGTGTQKVENTLKAIFPGVRTIRMDADTTRHKGSHDQLIRSFKSGKADILIGTQMIAKGLHFPEVTLVGVLNSDSSLNIPDFRSTEYTFQLLVQVAGRSGRGALSGEVLIQTYTPQHPIIELAAKQNYEAFFEEEVGNRELFDYPPYSKIVRFLMRGPCPKLVYHHIQQLRQVLIGSLCSKYEIQPVIECGYAKIKDQHRFQFLVKGPTTSLVTRHTQDFQINHSLPSSLRLFVDPDPTTTYF